MSGALLIASAWWLLGEVRVDGDTRLVQGPEVVRSAAIPPVADQAPRVAPQTVEPIAVSTPTAAPADGPPVVDATLVGPCLEAARYTLRLTRPGDGPFARTWRGEWSIQPQGWVRLDGLTPGPHSYTVEMDEVVLFTGDTAIAPGSQQLVFDCREMLGLAVEVVDEQGTALDAAVDVVAMNVPRLPSLRGEATAAGRSEVRPLPPQGEYFVVADAEGYAPTKLGPLTLAADDTPRRLRIELTKGGVVQGRAERPDGTPAVGAEVALDTSYGRRSGRTNDDGAFRLDAIPVGSARLVIASPGLPNVGADLQVCDVTACGPVESTFRFHEPCYVYGTAVDENGEPHGKLRLHATPLDCDDGTAPGGYTLVQESGGRFVIGPMPRGSARLVDLSDPSFSRIVHTGEELELVLSSFQRRTLRLDVSDVRGRPLDDDVTCAVFTSPTSMTGPFELAPDVAGRTDLAFRSSTPVVDLRVGAPGYESASVLGVDTRGAGVVEVVLTPEPEVSLDVVGGDGEALGGVSVVVRWPGGGGVLPGEFHGARLMNFADGAAWEQPVPSVDGRTFRVSRRGRDDLSYVVSAPGHLPARGAVPPHGGQVSIRLQKHVVEPLE